MSKQAFCVTVLGYDIPFKPSADKERIERAAKLVEERYASQKTKGNGVQSKDVLLTYVALGLADDFLQLKKMQDDVENHLETLLCTIEKNL